MNLKLWSKKKTFFLLMLFIGTAINVSANLLHLFLFDTLLIGGVSYAVFLIPMLFIVFSTSIFMTKITGFLACFFGGVLVFILQICFFIIISMIFSFFKAGVGNILTPTYIQGDKKFGEVVAKRFQEKYKISESNLSNILHSSYYEIGEEFGYDLIAQVDSSHLDMFAPAGTKFNLLKTNSDETPFRFSNKDLLCGEVGKSKIYIQDPDVKVLLCETKNFPANTLVAEKWVRLDWTITSVFFPDQEILWITEIEW